MKFWRESRENIWEKICEGALFERKHSHNLIETARVLSIAKDQFGIPHVKYEVKFERARSEAVPSKVHACSPYRSSPTTISNARKAPEGETAAATAHLG